MKNKKGKAKKKNNSSKNKVCLNDEKLIKIYEEACYRALKRIENEKEKQNDEDLSYITIPFIMMKILSRSSIIENRAKWRRPPGNSVVWQIRKWKKPWRQ